MGGGAKTDKQRKKKAGGRGGGAKDQLKHSGWLGVDYSLRAKNETRTKTLVCCSFRAKRSSLRFCGLKKPKKKHREAVDNNRVAKPLARGAKGKTRGHKTTKKIKQTNKQTTARKNKQKSVALLFLLLFRARGDSSSFELFLASWCCPFVCFVCVSVCELCVCVCFV